jgi:hypothetical protein
VCGSIEPGSGHTPYVFRTAPCFDRPHQVCTKLAARLNRLHTTRNTHVLKSCSGCTFLPLSVCLDPQGPVLGLGLRWWGTLD